MSDGLARARYTRGMDALPFAPIDLVAIDPARNLRRRWRIAAAHDLFGTLTIETNWGRIGRPGRTLLRSFVDEPAAAGYVAALLRARARAERRIGVGYCLRFAET